MNTVASRALAGAVPPAQRRPLDDVETTLRDGTPAFIWPLLPTDVAGLRDAFDHLSAEARRQRFLNGVNELNDAMIHRLVETVDGVYHIALILVVVPADGDDQPVGIARLVPDRTDPEVAHIACTVADGWRGRGVGSALTAALMARRPAGVRYLRADVAEDNAASLALVRGLGPVSVLACDSGVLEMLVHLDPDASAADEPGRPVKASKPERRPAESRPAAC